MNRSEAMPSTEASKIANALARGGWIEFGGPTFKMGHTLDDFAESAALPLKAKLAAAELEAFAAKEQAWQLEKDKSDLQRRTKQAIEELTRGDVSFALRILRKETP